MVGVEELYQTKEQLGVALITKYEVSKAEARSYNLSNLFNGSGMMNISSGTYVKLHVNGTLMMSDTDMEKNSNKDFVDNAKGDVMIAGLGIGLIIQNIVPKIQSGEVSSIVVYEKYQDVIDLVSPKFRGLPIKYVCADILDYKPKKDERYDTIYFDIWPTIDYETNLPEIRMLHNRWKSRKRDKTSWMNSWMKECMQRQKRADDYEESRYGWRW